VTVWLPPNIPTSLQGKLTTLLGDRELFCRMLKVYDKQLKKNVPLNVWPAQRKVWSAMDRSNRVLVVKARQMGISVGIRAYQFHKAFTSLDPLKYAVLSFHARSATNLRKLDREWLADLPEALKRDMSVDSATDSQFADTGAGFAAFTTGGRGGTRSFVFTGAQLSEFAFYTDPDEVLAQVLATVGDGPIIIETTVNAPGDAFHRLVEGAPENGWEVVFLPWYEHHPYQHTVPSDFACTSSEQKMKTQHGLTNEQVYWRRAQVATLGEHKFRREFPATLQECFIGVTKSAYLPSEALADIETVHFNTPYRVLEEVDLDDYYVIGADPAGGTGGDYSAMQVVSAMTYQPVYTERDNTIAPHEFAERLVQVAAKYTTTNGPPLILCEQNNHGHAVLRELDILGYKNVWTDANRKPWVTTHKSKIDAYDTLREFVINGMIFRLDQSTLMELRSLQILKVSPEAPAGLHDDLAMSLALAYRALRDVPRSKRREAVGARMESMMSNVKARKTRARRLPWNVRS